MRAAGEGGEPMRAAGEGGATFVAARNKAATTNLCPVVRCDKIKGWRGNRPARKEQQMTNTAETQARLVADNDLLAWVDDKGGSPRHRRDCVIRAISVAGRAAGLDGYEYDAVLADILEMRRHQAAASGRQMRNSYGTATKVYTEYLKARGWSRRINRKRQANLDRELINEYGRVIIASLSNANHVVAVVDGEVRDTWDSRFRQRYPTEMTTVGAMFTPPGKAKARRADAARAEQMAGAEERAQAEGARRRRAENERQARLAQAERRHRGLTR